MTIVSHILGAVSTSISSDGPKFARAPGSATHPNQIERDGQAPLGEPPHADDADWWFFPQFDAPNLPKSTPCHLVFDGLATLAEVWLNGEPILASDNMFRSYRVDVAGKLKPNNELAIVCRSLTHALAQKKSRPRWKTNLVAHQQLRWHRTTLLGRIPGWSPPIAPVGPWRGIRLEAGPILLIEPRIRCRVEGSDGVVDLDAKIVSALPIERAVLHVGGETQTVTVSADGQCRGQLRVANSPLWWPATHGQQSLLDAQLEVHAGGASRSFPLGRVGFRTIEQIAGHRFALKVNGEPIYCRGACWTVSDTKTLTGSLESLRRDLQLAKNAGVNMLRIGGTMVYESDPFYDLCDELGILVWQDFMFANMDYPVDDPVFAGNIHAEASEQLGRLSRHPCIAVYCGSSEIEQQAAMLGMPAELWRNAWFGEKLPALCRELHPGVPYIPSTPTGGTLPFHVREGVAHYYGVGAYRRTPADVRKDDVAFTAECLGFANIPEPATLSEVFGGDLPVVHDPRWKERSPRDTGTGWDFDDVRDFYLAHLFAVDPAALRSFDPERYLQLSCVVPGEMMMQVFAEWRGHGRNAGGLVWFFKDLWPGAGWGIVDSRGVPKAAYYALRRIWQPRQIAITNEGLEGLHVHVVNETAEPFRGQVELVLLKDDHIVIAQKLVACEIAGRSKATLSADAILGSFYDVAYAYRFGPSKHDVAIATLLDDQGRVISEAFDFPMAKEPRLVLDAEIRAEIGVRSDGALDATIASNRFLRNVSLAFRGEDLEDNYFHVVPGRTKTVRVTQSASTKIGGALEALNLPAPVKFAVRRDES